MPTGMREEKGWNKIMALLERFYPDIYVNSVFEMPLEDMKKLGIRGLVFDIDNTVAPFDVAEPDQEIVELFAYLRKQGFKLCILSNNTKDRVHLFNKKLGTLAVKMFSTSVVNIHHTIATVFFL